MLIADVAFMYYETRDDRTNEFVVLTTIKMRVPITQPNPKQQRKLQYSRLHLLHSIELGVLQVN